MATRPLTASHRAVSLAHYRQRREHAQAALQDAQNHPEGDARAAATHDAQRAIAAAQERVAALEKIQA